MSALFCRTLAYGRFTVRAFMGFAATVLMTSAWAQSTDISASPLFTSQTAVVKPNMLFILDDSGSMGWNYMPDEAKDNLGTGSYGYKSYQCNGVQYDPSYVYTTPVYANGTSYPNADFGAAWDNGYDQSAGTTDLANKTYYRYTGTQPKMGWTFTTTAPIKTTTFYKECASAVGSTPGSSVFTLVTMTSTSTDAQNYANWYSYYRTRMLMMKTAVGAAFKTMDDKFRIGFTTISRSLPSLNVSDFDATQKTTFYTDLYGTAPSGWTPLRGALSAAGQYYAKKRPSQTYDPIQYSCQRNFSLLSTDGYWNTNDESSSFGPLKLDNSTSVGQQDGVGTARPYYDGQQTNETVVYKWKRVDSTPTTRVTPRRVTSTSAPTTVTSTPVSAWTRNSYSTTTSGCSGGKKRLVTQPQSGITYNNVTTSQTTTTDNDYVDTSVTTNYSTENFTETITLVNGAVTSDTTTSNVSNNTPAATTAATTTTGPTTTTNVAAPVTSTTTTTTWTNNGTATQGSCVNSPTVPSPNPSTSVAATLTSTTPTVTSSTSTTGPTTTTGTVTTTTGSTTQGTPTAKTLDTAASTSTTTGGSSNSLADVAMYYYKTDLRNTSLGNCTGSKGTDVCSDNVNPSGEDTAGWQHMATFTLGLGAGSSLTYDFNYETQKAGDYYSILQGTKNWPVAAADTPTAIDDLWHAGVNGRGRFFGVQNATELSKSLAAALDSIRAITGTASAAATSTLQPVQGDNDIFVAQFTTVSWTGEILKYAIDPSSGAISAVTGWSVQTALESKSPAARNIFYKTPGAASLRAFNAANLSTDGYGGNFSGFCSKTGALGTGVPTQCGTLSTADLTAANTAGNLVDYLRGDKTATYYRARDKVLGDIVNASPVFVGKPHNAFTENNYPTFVANNSSRVGVVYAAANDGMLHAFLQTTGEELWAYIPTPMLSKLYKLADNNYASYHDYYVDGTPSTADVYFASDSKWHTILVGGYKAGGSGYYALDVTDPAAPQMLWEFTHVNMGLSYGNPIITKRKDGTWVVALTSGYNNHTGGGDGNGHLFVVDAATGSLLVDLPTYTSGTTPAGTTTAPSGLAMLNGWVDFDTENLTKRFYGTDLLGNVWRFDIDSYVAPFNSAMLLAQLRDASNTPQPVTTPPLVAEVTYNGTKYPMVYVATGKYLGTTDLSTTAQQSSYAFTDELTTTGYGNIRAANVLVTKTAGTNATVDWQAKRGWMYDFPTAGERANVNSTIALTTIYTATNLPSTDLCTVGGSSYKYEFDLFTGNVVRAYMGASLIVGMTVVQLASDGANAGATQTIITRSTGNLDRTSGTPSATSVKLRRTSWRELN